MTEEIEHAAQSILDSFPEALDKIKERESNVAFKFALWTLAMGMVAALGQGAVVAGIASVGIRGKEMGQFDSPFLGQLLQSNS